MRLIIAMLSIAISAYAMSQNLPPHPEADVESGIMSANAVLAANGNDLGAAINAQYAALPPSGGVIRVKIPADGLSFSTPIVIGTAQKPAIIDCLMNTGVPGVHTPPMLVFTPSTGNALTFNVSAGRTAHQRGFGTRNCAFEVSGSAIALYLGGTNGAEGFEDQDTTYEVKSASAKGIVVGENTWQIDLTHDTVQGAGQLLDDTNGSNSGEQMVFNGVTFASAGANAVVVGGAGTQFECNDCSFDDAQFVGSAALVTLKGPHFENPGGPISYPFLVNSGNMYISSPNLGNDFACTSSCPNSMISLTGGNTVITGLLTVSAHYNYPALISLSGAANLYEMEPAVGYGFGNAWISGSTTGRYVVDTGNLGIAPQYLSNKPTVFNVPSLQATTDTYKRWGSLLNGNQNAPSWQGIGTADNSNIYHASVGLMRESAAQGCQGATSAGLGFFTEDKASGNTDTSALSASIDCRGNLHSLGGVYVGNGAAGKEVIPAAAGGSTGAPTGLVQLDLTGTTGRITGTPLAGSCDSGTARVPGAIVGHPVAVSSTNGADPGGSFNLRASVSSPNIVTVFVCGTGTPLSLTYNVTVM